MKHSPEALSWDDLRIVKAIGEHGGLMNAAFALGVNHSTLSRRLSALENALGFMLFERRRTGYLPTGAGVELLDLSRRMESDILAVMRRMTGRTEELNGELRITTSDALLVDFLTPIIADFRAMHPGVRIEVIVGNQCLNLARGDSDIAFRATLSPPENLFGRKMATVAWAIYGRRIDYLDREVPEHALYEAQWVSYGRGLSGLKAHGYIDRRVSPRNISYRSDSVYGVAAAVRNGIGIGILPCMHGDLDAGLVRIGPVASEVHDELWLLTHPDIRRSPRITAFMTHCARAIETKRDFIEGKRPRAESSA
ncbi:LysR family transcriptional regulator [Bordetella genomosp. 11]|uniref:HTH lysR-type domain-containing protein n=1 Tax=Bordetella genomosp. 11 TaxID=1416808 RepID=A0A261UXZ2_9BORD|nr:LysR family transcriptional regulator [Bordetella genomosp. 11]OZI66766.1 hypothetical protein CAL28_03315 [Bordetella genomosp. 11]